MMNPKVYRNWVMPTIVPVGVILVTLALIVVIGKLLIKLAEGDPSSEIRRPELWVATGLSLLVLGVCTALALRPAGSLGKFDEDLAVGTRPMLDPPLPPIGERVRSGELGSLNDLEAGYVLYARNGALAKVVEILPSAQESYGHLRQGLVFAQGLHGAANEMWIPGEAVSSVYPETRSAFLAIAGDEIEYLGWHRPPASFRRTAPREEQKLY